MAPKVLVAHPKHDNIKKQILLKRDSMMKQSQGDLKNCIGNHDKTQVGDYKDLAATMSNEHFQASIGNCHRKALQDIDNALIRINDRSYGICVDCEEEIFKKRLDAFPLAKRCRDCQEEHEWKVKHASAAGFGTTYSD
jgi:RNA polymerase-binding protein DksA